MMTNAQKERNKAVTTNVLHHYDTKGDGVLLRIVTGDETWVHHF
jgi:hypothetical protein